MTTENIINKLESLGYDAEQATYVMAALELVGAGQEGTDATALAALETILKGGPMAKTQAYLDLAEIAIPARVMVAKATGRVGADLYEMDGRQALDAIASGLGQMLNQATLKRGDRVRVASGRLMAGQIGRIRKIKREGILTRYLVSFDGRKQSQLTPFLAADLISLDTPRHDGDGGYFTPVYRTPSGNEVLLNYPDMAAPTIADAQVCQATFGNSYTGVIAALNGLATTNKIARVEAKKTYITAVLTLEGGLAFDVTVIAGPDVDKHTIELFEQGESKAELATLALAVPVVTDLPAPGLITDHANTPVLIVRSLASEGGAP